MSEARPRVVVVGGGIGGLTAAFDLGADHEVLLLEGSPDVGGKLRLATVAGVAVDVGAEAMLSRRPEGLALAAELGLSVVHPTGATSRLWSRGALRPLPRSLMGVPFDVHAVADSGVLSEAGLARLRAERESAVPDADVSVGDLVGDRLGDEVVERLVEPLLGGVYAGNARELSARSAVPQLLELARRGPLLAQVAALPRSDAPVFAGLPGGMGRLPAALVGSGRFEVRTGAVVRGLEREGAGYRLTVGSTRDARSVSADAVVIAVPPTPAARLLADLAPAAAAELATIETASVAVVTLAFRAADLDPALTRMSGFLVPPVERRRIKAATFSFAKWAWVREAGEGLLLLRTSLGRHREEALLQRSDAELVEVSLAELAELAGIRGRPVDAHVQRWGGGLPQLAVGHAERIDRVRAAVSSAAATGPGAGRLAVCGAAYDGVGIPAVIGSARRAAATLRGAQWRA